MFAESRRKPGAALPYFACRSLTQRDGRLSHRHSPTNTSTNSLSWYARHTWDAVADTLRSKHHCNKPKSCSQTCSLSGSSFLIGNRLSSSKLFWHVDHKKQWAMGSFPRWVAPSISFSLPHHPAPPVNPFLSTIHQLLIPPPAYCSVTSFTSFIESTCSAGLCTHLNFTPNPFFNSLPHPLCLLIWRWSM